MGGLIVLVLWILAPSVATVLIHAAFDQPILVAFVSSFAGFEMVRLIVPVLAAPSQASAAYTISWAGDLPFRLIECAVLLAPIALLMSRLQPGFVSQASTLFERTADQVAGLTAPSVELGSAQTALAVGVIVAVVLVRFIRRRRAPIKGLSSGLQEEGI